MTAGPRDTLSVLLGGRRSAAPTGSRRPFSSSSSHQNKKNAPGQLLRSAKSSSSAPMPTATKFLCVAVLGTSAFFYGWVKPRLEVLRDELLALRIERSILIKAVEECQRTHILKPARDDDSIDPCQAQMITQDE